jgi:hypothetical protein
LKAGSHWLSGLKVNVASLKPVGLFSLLLVLLIGFYAEGSLADVPPQQVNEVNYLIEYIRNSPCLLERNNKKYKGEEAIEHILRKYDYYREEITSTEDFIKYSATKSEMSGKVYMAYCEGSEPIDSFTWLMTELERYRESRVLHG